MHLKRGVGFARPFGIPLVVHGSWFPAAGLLVIHFAATAYRAAPPAAAVALGALTALLFFASLVGHELAHALVARARGLPVVDITLFVFGGVARIAREPARPEDEVLIAAAGPLWSAAVGATAVALAPDGWIGDVTLTLGLGNLALAVFNLLPGFPLDGGRLLRALVWAKTGDRHRAALVAGRVGQLLAVLLALAGVGAWTFAHLALEALWLVTLGVFLYVLATSARRGARVAARLGRESAGRFVRPFAGAVSPETSLSMVVRRAAGDASPFAVADAGRLAGVVLPHAAASAGPGALVRDTMVPWSARLSYPCAGSLIGALEALAAKPGGVLVVVDDSGSAVGVLDEDAVRARLHDLGDVAVGSRKRVARVTG